MEAKEGNKIIVDFMQDQVAINAYEVNPEMLEYHSSWDWLMPVVKKIAGMVINKDWDNCLEAVKRWKPIANELQKVNTENVWYCVVKFIQWYNKQLSNEN